VIRVIIADDHPVVIHGIREILSATGDIRLLDDAVSGAQLLEKLSEGRFDLVLLDISMPGGNGLDVLRRVKERFPDLPVLMLSMHPDEEYAVRTLKAGASGYLNKESVPGELVRAIRKVSAGGTYLKDGIAETVAGCGG
jgi:two-component system invasion response regulator UvrY